MGDESFLSLVKNAIIDYWDDPALTDYDGETYLYKDFAKKIAELHILFDVANLQKGDKIALCGRNSANWVVAFFASLTYGVVATTILHDFSSESIHSIVNHSDAKLFFVGDNVWNAVDQEQMPGLETIILLNDFSIQKSSSPRLLEVSDELEFLFKKKYPNGFFKESLIFHIESPDELAILNYTSGTTSSPKGVMISYRSLWSNSRFAVDNIPFVKPRDGVVCMLPMAHMYGLAFEILLSIIKGCHIHFLMRIPSPQVLLDTFAKVRPTLILAVPLIIEKIIQNKVFPELRAQPVRLLFKLPFLKKIIYKKVLNKLLNIFGGNLQEIVIGGAALKKQVGEFLTAIKFPYTVGYGMTECGPLITYEYWKTYRCGSCGRSVDRMQIKIDSANIYTIPGEIKVKGDNVMLGYYKNMEDTKAVIDAEGWLNTGDLGVMDSDGFLYIKGRSKTMILGASGQNIYPEEIEDLLNESIYISESLIIEEDNKLVALIYPNQDSMDHSHLTEDDYDRIFAEEIKLVNKRLPLYSKIFKYRLRKEEFEKTPKRSIKRYLYQQNK